MHKCMPGRTWPDETSDLFHEDQKDTAPDRSAMDLMRRPQVVRRQEEKEYVRRSIGRIAIMKQDRDVPTKERRPADPGRCNDD